MEQSTRIRNEFSSQPIYLPKPYFVVFYNGTDEQPERRLFRLSDIYEPKSRREMIRITEEQPDLELKTLAININKGYNEELKKSCRDLFGYMIYVDKVREFAKVHPLGEAVEMAITYCIQNDILADFLAKHRAEVMSMSIFEYNQEQHFRQIATENQAVGWEKGKLAGKAEVVLSFLSEGGTIPVELSDRIMGEQNLETLEAWIKLAAKVGDPALFAEELSKY